MTNDNDLRIKELTALYEQALTIKNPLDSTRLKIYGELKVRNLLAKIYASKKLSNADLTTLNHYMSGALSYEAGGLSLDPEEAYAREKFIYLSGGNPALYSDEEKALLRETAYANIEQIKATEGRVIN